MKELSILFSDIIIPYFWVVAPVVLFFILYETWLFYIQTRYKASIPWVVLEVRLPKEVEKSPKAFELILSGIHGIYSKRNLMEKYLKGMVPEWVSFEVISIGGETHFLIRTNSKWRNLIESKIYAEYPAAEIHEVTDYVTSLPPVLPDHEYNLWGTEMTLTKPDAYPIRTYEFFEEIKEEKRHDPLSSLLETISRIGPREQIWVQFVISPVMDGWREQGEEIVAKLAGKEIKKPRNPLVGLGDIVMRPLEAGLSGTAIAQTAGAGQEMPKIMRLTPGEREVIEAIEENIAKIGFNTTTRFVYLAPHDIYSGANIAAIIGFFRQFNTQNMNGFKPDSRTVPSIDYLFPGRRNYWRKKRIFQNYRERFMNKHPYVLNIEELATVYHFPGRVVQAPLMPRIGAKKGEPPAGLPIEQ